MQECCSISNWSILLKKRVSQTSNDVGVKWTIHARSARWWTVWLCWWRSEVWESRKWPCSLGVWDRCVSHLHMGCCHHSHCVVWMDAAERSFQGHFVSFMPQLHLHRNIKPTRACLNINKWALWLMLLDSLLVCIILFFDYGMKTAECMEFSVPLLKLAHVIPP